jgi:hypothetical protein
MTARCAGRSAERQARSFEVRRAPVADQLFPNGGGVMRIALGHSVFRSPYVIGGNIGSAFVRATVDRFEIGQETPLYYQPDNPTEACLIRRPSLYVYLVILGPVIPLRLVLCVAFPY